MPRIDIGTSIDEIKDEGFQPLPAGPYTLKVDHAELTDNKAKDAKVLLMHHVVVSPDEYAGRKVMYDRLSLKTTAAWKLKRFLTAAQVPYEGSSFNTEDVLGSTFKAQVATTTTAKGRLVNEVADYIVS